MHVFLLPVQVTPISDIFHAICSILNTDFHSCFKKKKSNKCDLKCLWRMHEKEGNTLSVNIRNFNDVNFILCSMMYKKFSTALIF